MNKIIEIWSKRSPFEKAISIIAIVLLVVYLLMLFLFAFDIMEGAEGISKLIMGVLWGLLGFAWWKKNRKFAILYFAIALGHFVLSAVLLLN